jgi:hypothetical protein
MSKHINVNPDHYKLAGRERPGDALPKPPKQRASEDEALERWDRKVRTKKEEVRGKKNEHMKGRKVELTKKK